MPLFFKAAAILSLKYSAIAHALRQFQMLREEWHFLGGHFSSVGLEIKRLYFYFRVLVGFTKDITIPTKHSTLPLYLLYEIKTLCVVHPVDSVPLDTFPVDHRRKTFISQAIKRKAMCMCVRSSRKVHLLYSSCSREKMCLLKYS